MPVSEKWEEAVKDAETRVKEAKAALDKKYRQLKPLLQEFDQLGRAYQDARIALLNAQTDTEEAKRRYNLRAERKKRVSGETVTLKDYLLGGHGRWKSRTWLSMTGLEFCEIPSSMVVAIALPFDVGPIPSKDFLSFPWGSEERGSARARYDEIRAAQRDAVDGWLIDGGAIGLDFETSHAQRNSATIVVRKASKRLMELIAVSSPVFRKANARYLKSGRRTTFDLDKAVTVVRPGEALGDD